MGTFQQLYQPSTWCSRHQLPLVLKKNSHGRHPSAEVMTFDGFCALLARITAEGDLSGEWSLGKNFTRLNRNSERKALERSLGVKKNTVLGECFFDDSSIVLSQLW